MTTPKNENPIRYYRTCLDEAERRAAAAAPAASGTTSAVSEIVLLRALIRRLGEILLQPLALDEQIKVNALLLRAFASLAALLRLEAALTQAADDELAQALKQAVQDEEATAADQAHEAV